MTSAHDHVLRWRAIDIARWGMCAVAILAVHAGAAAYMVLNTPLDPPAGAPVEISIEMLPEAAAPPSEPTEAPPGPETPKVEDQPEKLAEKHDEEEAMPEEVAKPVEPEPEAPPAPLAPPPEVAVAQPEPEPPKKEEEAKPVEKKPELPKRPQPKKKRVEKPRPRSAPPPSPQSARAQNAPASTSSIPSTAMPAWNNTISAMLKRNLRYPSDAERRGVRGVATVRLSINGNGGLVSASLVRSSGDSQLDQEAVAVARRTAPFPPPPDGRAARRVIPIRFSGE